MLAKTNSVPNRIALSLLALTIRKRLSYCLQLGNLVEDSLSNL